MKRTEVNLGEFCLDALGLTNNCLLVTSGELGEGKFNSMTISWGFFGNMWSAPMVLIAIRKSRYTNEFLKTHDDFTLTVLPEDLKDVYGLLGTKSGRDSNKMKESGLTPIESTDVLSPSFAEASLTFECRKVYAGEIDKSGVIDPEILKVDYADGDFHDLYIGRIVKCWKKED